jgi:hypothetical protein
MEDESRFIFINVGEQHFNYSSSNYINDKTRVPQRSDTNTPKASNTSANMITAVCNQITTDYQQLIIVQHKKTIKYRLKDKYENTIQHIKNKRTKLLLKNPQARSELLTTSNLILKALDEILLIVKEKIKLDQSVQDLN